MTDGHLLQTPVANQAARVGTLDPGSPVLNKHIATKRKEYMRKAVFFLRYDG